MRIGDLATRAGVSVRSLRYYEEQGLVPSQRTAAGQRVYEESDVDRVLLIRQLFAAGLTSKAIRGVMPCVDDPGESTHVDALGRMREARGQIDAQIADLLATRDNLDAIIALAEGPHDCAGVAATA